MDEFGSKTVEELGDWLQDQKFSDVTVKVFKDNEVDGEAFLLLSDHQIASMVKAIGAQLKLIKKRDSLNQQHLTAPQPAQAQKRLLTDDDSSDGPDGLSSSEMMEEGLQDEELFARTVDRMQEASSCDLPITPTRSCDSVSKPKHLKLALEEGSSISAWQRVASKRKQEAALPMPFELPHNFKPNIQEGLDNCCLNGRARTKFVTSIAESMYRFKSYPTGEEYEHVSRQIVKKWSFLNTSTSHGYFVETLKGRMAYLRKPDGQKRGKGNPSPVAAVQRKPLMPLCQSLSPVALVCEDKASHERHLKALKKEYKSLHPNKQATKELMKRTFGFRRQDVLDGKYTTESLFAVYPPMKSPNEIINELNRIMARDVAGEVEDIWRDLSVKIIECAKEEDNAHIGNMLEDLPIPDNQLCEDGKSLLATCLLYHLLHDTRTKPDVRLVVTISEESISDYIGQVPTAQPCIAVKGSFAAIQQAVLVVERQIVAPVDPKRGPLVLIAAFYAYNMHYPFGCKNFYTFLEVAFLKVKKPAKMTRLTGLLARLSPAMPS